MYDKKLVFCNIYENIIKNEFKFDKLLRKIMNIK